jgi:hypothetical protein
VRIGSRQFITGRDYSLGLKHQNLRLKNNNSHGTILQLYMESYLLLLYDVDFLKNNLSTHHPSQKY